MNLHNLIKTTSRSKKRLGRGLGSGKGKTVGRGTKGQKARGKIPASFIGGTLPLYKKLPLKRGKGNPTLGSKTKALNLAALNIFKANAVVDVEQLLSQGLITQSEARKHGIKILGTGSLDKPLTIKLSVSKEAKSKIEKAGGKVESV